MSRTRKAIWALVAVALVFGTLEGGLHLAGFSYRRITTHMQFNYPRPGFLKAFFEIDSELLYRIRPTVKQRWVDLTWQPRFDLKIRDARVFGPKPAGTARVIALGDSSTYGVNTPRPWPQRLQELLDRRRGLGRFEVMNLGVPGYTAFQGRRILETRGQRLEPDALVIAFGWNDHLLALGYTDAEQRVGGAAVVGLRNALGGSRVYQALSWLVARWRGEAVGPREGRGREPAAGTDPLLAAPRRVGPGAFREELRRLVLLSRQLGAVPLLCTYPTALSHLAESGREAPAWLAETHVGWGGAGEVWRLQQVYNDTIRDVAAEAGAPLVDLEAQFARAGKLALFGRDSLSEDPTGDVVHPNERGYDLVAEMIYRGLAAALGGGPSGPVGGRSSTAGASPGAASR